MWTSAYLQPEHMTPFSIAGDDFQFFIGDENCKEITGTTDTVPKIYTCITGANIQNIHIMRFSLSGEAELANQ